MGISRLILLTRKMRLEAINAAPEASFKVSVSLVVYALKRDYSLVAVLSYGTSNFGKVGRKLSLVHSAHFKVCPWGVNLDVLDVNVA